MTSADTPSADTPSDEGLLSPGWAGSPAEAATGDAAFLRAMLDAEAALARAAAVGLAPAGVAEAVTRAAREVRLAPRALALRARGGGNPVIPLVAEPSLVDRMPDLACLTDPAGYLGSAEALIDRALGQEPS